MKFCEPLLDSGLLWGCSEEEKLFLQEQKQKLLQEFGKQLKLKK